MMRARVLLAAVVGLLLVTVARAETPVTEPQRYQTLIHELRCLVCQNQSIAESNAPLAQDLIKREAPDDELHALLAELESKDPAPSTPTDADRAEDSVAALDPVPETAPAIPVR